MGLNIDKTSRKWKDVQDIYKVQQGGVKVEEKHLYPDSKEIEDVRIVWNEYGYKLIEVTLKDGETYLVESDN